MYNEQFSIQRKVDKSVKIIVCMSSHVTVKVIRIRLQYISIYVDVSLQLSANYSLLHEEMKFYLLSYRSVFTCLFRNSWVTSPSHS